MILLLLFILLHQITIIHHHLVDPPPPLSSIVIIWPIPTSPLSGDIISEWPLMVYSAIGISGANKRKETIQESQSYYADNIKLQLSSRLFRFLYFTSMVLQIIICFLEKIEVKYLASLKLHKEPLVLTICIWIINLY